MKKAKEARTHEIFFDLSFARFMKSKASQYRANIVGI